MSVPTSDLMGDLINFLAVEIVRSIRKQNETLQIADFSDPDNVREVCRQLVKDRKNMRRELLGAIDLAIAQGE